MESLFLKAVKTGLTFPTERGAQTPQVIYQLPLTGNNGFNLDTLSRTLLKKMRSVEEESLVTESKVDSTDELRLEILKYIIKDKQEEQEAQRLAVFNREEMQRLLKLKANKQNEKEAELSEEEIDAQIAKLS